MAGMFVHAERFDGDISKWDISRVTDMEGMFSGAIVFTGDISEWDVSSVVNTNRMCIGAKSFNHELCGAAWVNSNATKDLMFQDLSGSIPSTVCETTTHYVFAAI